MIGVEVHAVRIAGEEQASGRVADDGEVGVVHRREHPRGHLRLGHVETAVHRGDDEIEPVEDRVIVVDPPILQDVGLDPLEHPESRQPGVDRVDLLRLAREVVRR